MQHRNQGQRAQTEQRRRHRDTERERKRRALFEEEKKKTARAPPSSRASGKHSREQKSVRRSRGKTRDNCAFLRVNLRNLSHSDNSLKRKEARRSGYRASERERKAMTISKRSCFFFLLPLFKPVRCRPPSPSLSRALSFRSLSRAMLSGENARQHGTGKHLRAARPGGAAGREAWLVSFFPTSLLRGKKSYRSRSEEALFEGPFLFLTRVLCHLSKNENNCEVFIVKQLALFFFLHNTLSPLFPLFSLPTEGRQGREARVPSALCCRFLLASPCLSLTTTLLEENKKTKKKLKRKRALFFIFVLLSSSGFFLVPLFSLFSPPTPSPSPPQAAPRRGASRSPSRSLARSPASRSCT